MCDMTNFKVFLWICLLLIFNNSVAEILPSFPEPVQQAELSIYKIKTQKETIFENETGFFIAPSLLVTSFHSIGRLDLENENFNEIELFQQNQLSALKIKKVIAISAVFDVALLETQGTSDYHLKVNPQTPEPFEDLFTIGYPQGVFTKLQKTGSLLRENSGYCFIHQASFDHLDGANGSPVLNSQDEVTGMILEGVMHTNSLCATNPDTINQLVENKIGTNCNQFESVTDCVESELNSIKQSSRSRNTSARNFGMYRASSYRPIQLANYLQSLQSVSSVEDLTKLAQFTGNFEEDLWREYEKLQSRYIYWLTISAEQGSFQAQYTLASLYEEGEDVIITTPNKSQAAYWMKQSARQGYAPAQHMMSLFYSHGEGVKKNMQEASYWMQKAAKQGLIPSQQHLATDSYERIPQDLEKTFYWTTQAAEQGYAPAQHTLSTLYSAGTETPQNAELAFYWMQKAAEQDHAPAQHTLSTLYSAGTETPQNAELAFYWMQKAAEQDHAPAQHDLSHFYDEGYGTQQNTQETLYWMQKAAEQEFIPAIKDLAVIYSTGDNGIQQDLEKVFYWTMQAAEQGDPESQYKLFTLYSNGEGTRPNHEKAMLWLEQSAEQGYEQAQLALEKLSSSDSPILDWISELLP